MKFLSSLLTLMSFSAYGSAYLELGGGVQHRMLDGDNGNYKSNQSLATEASIGYRFENFDLALDGLYTYGRQKDFSYNYAGVTSNDEFNWHSVSVGPTLKYHIKSQSGTWAWAPFAGVFYNHTSLDNSGKLTDSTTGLKEDNSHKAWGYGGKLGVQFTQFKPESKILESVNYKIYGSYTKYRGTEGNYIIGGALREYDGDTPDNLTDVSVGFLVSFSFGDKLYQKAKTKLGLN